MPIEQQTRSTISTALGRPSVPSVPPASRAPTSLGSQTAASIPLQKTSMSSSSGV